MAYARDGDPEVAAYQSGHAAGLAEGRVDGYKEVLTLLEDRYMKDETHEEGHEADKAAILKIASEVAAEMRKKLETPGG